MIFWGVIVLICPYVILDDPRDASPSLASAPDADEIWIAAAPTRGIDRCRELNDALASTASRDSRLRWLAAVSPFERGASDEIARAADLGAIGVGPLDPSAQRWRINDPRETWRLAHACTRRGLFAVIRSRIGTDDGWKCADADGIYALARSHPELTVVVTSLGSGIALRWAESGSALVLSRVYMLTQETGEGEERLIAAARAVAPDRILDNGTAIAAMRRSAAEFCKMIR